MVVADGGPGIRRPDPKGDGQCRPGVNGVAHSRVLQRYELRVMSDPLDLEAFVENCKARVAYAKKEPWVTGSYTQCYAEDVPALIAEVEALRAALGEVLDAYDASMASEPWQKQ